MKKSEKTKAIKSKKVVSGGFTIPKLVDCAPLISLFGCFDCNALDGVCPECHEDIIMGSEDY